MQFLTEGLILHYIWPNDLLPNQDLYISIESQSQNPEFRNNPESFHPCIVYVFIISKNRAQNLRYYKHCFQHKLVPKQSLTYSP